MRALRPRNPSPLSLPTENDITIFILSGTVPTLVGKYICNQMRPARMSCGDVRVDPKTADTNSNMVSVDKRSPAIRSFKVYQSLRPFSWIPVVENHGHFDCRGQGIPLLPCIKGTFRVRV